MEDQSCKGNAFTCMQVLIELGRQLQRARQLGMRVIDPVHLQLKMRELVEALGRRKRTDHAERLPQQGKNEQRRSQPMGHGAGF